MSLRNISYANVHRIGGFVLASAVMALVAYGGPIKSAAPVNPLGLTAHSYWGRPDLAKVHDEGATLDPARCRGEQLRTGLMLVRVQLDSRQYGADHCKYANVALMAEPIPEADGARLLCRRDDVFGFMLDGEPGPIVGPPNSILTCEPAPASAQ